MLSVGAAQQTQKTTLGQNQPVSATANSSDDTKVFTSAKLSTACVRCLNIKKTSADSLSVVVAAGCHCQACWTWAKSLCLQLRFKQLLRTFELFPQERMSQQQLQHSTTRADTFLSDNKCICQKKVKQYISVSVSGCS